MSYLVSNFLMVFAAMLPIVNPAGSAPDTVSAGVGTPSADTVNVPACPTTNTAWSALVKAGTWSTWTVSRRAATAKSRSSAS